MPKIVAPYAGAWIEILCITPTYNLRRKSHPTRVRGLKCYKLKSHARRKCRTLRGCVD